MAKKETKENDPNGEFRDKVYLQERKLLFGGGIEGANAFDKAILTLSSSAFGISITFIRNIAPNIIKWTSFILIISWLLFLTSISLILIALLKSQVSILKSIENLDSEDENSNIENEIISLSNIIDKFNWLSVISFIAGSLLLAIFSFLNIYLIK